MPLFGIHGGKYRAVISADSQHAVYDGVAVRVARVVLYVSYVGDNEWMIGRRRRRNVAGASVYDSTNNPHVRK